LTELDSKIEQLKKKAEAARLQKARAEAAIENAEKEKAAILEELKTGFGLDNLTAARAKLLQLQEDLADKVSSIETILSKF
jgi:chromosome segregation ATPase